MPRLKPAKPTRYSFFTKADLGVRGVVWTLVSFVNLIVSGFSEMKSLFSIRRSAVKGNFSIDAMNSLGVIKVILITIFAFAAIQGDLLAQIVQRGTATTNATTLSGSNRTLTINRPTGVVAGDVLIASIVQFETDNDNGGLSNATLSGWTLIRGGLIRSDGTGNGNNAWWGTYLYRIADGTEGDSFSFSMPNDRADMAIGSIIAFSGVNTTGGVGPTGTGDGPFDVASSSFTIGNDDVPTVSGITVSANAAVVFLAQVSNDRTYSSWVDGSSSLTLNEIFDQRTTLLDDASVGGAWGNISSAGSTGTTEVTLSGSDRWGAVLFALRPSKFFRSRATGNWNSTNTWQESVNGTTWINATTVPNRGDKSVIIQNGHTVTVTAVTNVPELSIQTGGVLRLGVSGAISNPANLNLEGGSFRTGASTGFSEDLGDIDLNENSTIALGTGNHTLTFLASNGISWTAGKTLTITGWTGSASSSGTAGKIRVGTNTSGLSSSQLAQIQFDGYPIGALILSNGEIVPDIASSTVTVKSETSTSFTYTGSAQGPGLDNFDFTGSTGTRSVSYIGTGSTSYSSSPTPPTNAGTYEVVASVAADATFSGASSEPFAFTINKANSTITATGTTTFIYTGSLQGPTTSTISGSTGAITYSYSGTGSTIYAASATRPTNAGTYQVIATVAADANYNGATSAALAFTINKAVLTITANDQTVAFGTPVATVSGNGSYIATGFVNGETASIIGGSASYTTTYTATTAAGTAGVTITPVVTNLTATNYSFTPANGTITISKANSTITVNSPTTSIVTGSTGAVTYSYSGTGTTTYGPTAVLPTASGTYQVVATVASDANFNEASSAPFAFEISKANSSVTVKSGTVSNFTYSGLAQGPGVSDFDFAGSTGAKTVLYTGTGSTSYSSSTPPTNVGTYQVVASVVEDANFSEASSTAFSFLISPKAITVMADAKTKIYGASDPALTFQVTSGSLVLGDQLTGSLARAAGENATTYPINQGTLANSNYSITFVGANLTITPRAITVTADAKSKIYGNADPVLTYQISSGSLAFTDSFSGSLTRDAGENVGSYAITQGTLALSNNYALSYVGANLTITTRAITVTADAKTKIYGNADPALTYQITTGSLASGDSFSGSLSRATGETIGTYAITQGSLALNSNYALSYVGANLTITSRAITVTADAKSKEYGSLDPELTYGITSGTLVSGDSFSGSLSRATGENVGSYPITQGTLALNSNYTLTFVSANLTIAPRAITITADPQSKIYGAVDPTFTYQITSGSLVGSDVLSGSLSREAGENAGTYALTLGSLANPNYTLTLVSANLSITPKTLVITPNSGQSKQEEAADPILTYEASGWERTDNVSLLTGALSREAGEAPGTYPITLGTLAVTGSNYLISFTEGVAFTILELPGVKLVFVDSPAGTSTVAGQPFANQPVVQIQNERGRLVSSSPLTPVTLSLLEGSGELRGVVTLDAVNGIATFSGLNIDLAGEDKRLFAAAEALESDSTAAFTIVPEAASLFTKYAGDQQVTQAGSAVDIAPAVRITDIFGNPISGVSVSFAVTLGGGSIEPTTTVPTNADGVASLTSWILGTAAGQNTLTASAFDLTPTTFTALGSLDATDEFSANGTWLVPPGVTKIVVEAWGAGGAGGGVNGSSGNTRVGGGGGGGAYTKSNLAVVPGTTLTLIVGQGGNPTAVNQNGPNGGSTYIVGFENELFAEGGRGGLRINASGDPASGGAGGSLAGSKGGIDIRPGQAGNRGGENNFSNTNNTNGKGGDSGLFGIGGFLVSTGNGVNGTPPGGGGSGGASTSSTDRRGAVGGAGKIIITYPQPVNQFRPATSGNWEDEATWEQQFSNGQFARIDTKPSENSTVIISKPGVAVQGAPATVTVTVSEDLNFTGSIIVTSEGELALASGKNLSLTSGSSLTIANEGLLTLPADGLVLGAGNVSVNRGSTLSIAHPEGVKAIGTAGGAIQNTGTRSFNAEANYHYNGTSAQVIGNGLPATVNGLVIDNPTKVTLDRPLEVALDLEVNSGVLELNETLTVDLGMELKGSSRLLVKTGKKFQADLLADLTTGGTSRIVLEPGAKYLNLGISTPRLEVQQRLDGAKGWRMLGAPVAGSTYSGFLAGLETQGFTGSSNPGLQPNVIWWNEQDGGTTTQGWRQPSNISEGVPAGRGHYVFVFDGAEKKAGGSYEDELPITLSAIGDEVNLNNGGFDFEVTYTPRSQKVKASSGAGNFTEVDSLAVGFNLIANPTASFIDFFADGWTKTNIDNSIYVWNQNFNAGQGRFEVITSETPASQRMLAPYQGFWVRTNAANPSLVMTNAVKADEFSAFYGRVLEDKPATPASQIRLNVAGEGLKAEASVRVSEEGQDGLDSWDAFQLESLDNNWLNLYTLGSPKELTPLAINHLSLPTEGEKTIPLYLAAAKNGKPFSGTYTLNWDLPAELAAGSKVVLMDHISKKAIDMSEVKTYTFNFEAPISTNARVRDEEGDMKQPQAVVFSHEIKDGEGENYRTAAGKVTRPFTLVIGYTGQGSEPEYRPETAKLYTPSPNPFEDRTQVKFYLPVAEEVEIKIYDMKGQEVGGFAPKTYPSGINVLDWMPTAVHLPKGVYLIQMQTETMVLTQKAIKL